MALRISLKLPMTAGTPASGQGTSGAALAPVQSLSDTLMLRVFRQLEAQEAAKKKLVCRDWNRLLIDNSIWNSFLSRDFGFPEEEREAPEKIYRDCLTVRRTTAAMSTSDQMIVQPYGEVSLLQSQVKTVHSLPKEVLLHIFTFLRIEDVAAAKLSCLNWDELLADEFLWGCFLRRDFQVLEKSTDPKALYQRLHRIRFNLSNGVYYLITRQFAQGGVGVYIPFGDETIISCRFEEETIMVWNFVTGKCSFIKLNSMPGHDSEFEFSQALLHPDGRTLILGYQNGLIATLDLEQQIYSIIEPRDEDQFGSVSGLVLTKKGTLISSHYNPPEIRFWHLEGEEGAHKTVVANMVSEDGITFQEFVVRFEEDENIVDLMLTKDEKLIFGFESGDMMTWHRPEEPTSAIHFRSHMTRLTLSPTDGEPRSTEGRPVLGFENGDSGTLDNSDEATRDHVEFGRFVLTGNGKVVAGTERGEVFVWNIEKDIFEKIFNNEIGVQYLNFSKRGKLIVGLIDGRINVWDLKNGILENTFEENMGDSVCTGLLTDKDKLILDCGFVIKILDFAASHKAVFKELAARFESEPLKHRQTMERFLRMPQKQREKIYAELSKILAIEGVCGADAFQDQNGWSSTLQQKAQAIRSCLNEKLLGKMLPEDQMDIV